MTKKTNNETKLTLMKILNLCTIGYTTNFMKLIGTGRKLEAIKNGNWTHTKNKNWC